MKGVLRWLTFRRLLLAVLPTAALTAGGVVAFGGEDDDAQDPAKAQRPAQTIPLTPEGGAAADDGLLGIGAEPERPAKPERKRKRAKDADRADEAGDDVDVSAGPAPPAPDPRTDGAAAVRQAVTDTLGSVGYAGAKVEVSDGGRVVRIAVRRSQACDRDALVGARLTSRIRSGLPEIETVRVTVAGSGRSLSDYRRTRCGGGGTGGGSPSGGGTGRAVYSKRGSGTFTTPRFTIAARTWTVTYRNESDFFQAFVVKDGRIQPFVLTSDRRGTGTETFRGPGRFQLKINGAEGWSVTVRDGT